MFQDACWLLIRSELVKSADSTALSAYSSLKPRSNRGAVRCLALRVRCERGLRRSSIALLLTRITQFHLQFRTLSRQEEKPQTHLHYQLQCSFTGSGVAATLIR